MPAQSLGKLSADDLVRILHRRRLQYRAGVAHGVSLVEAPAGSPTIPTIDIYDPFGARPTLAVAGRALPPFAWSYDDKGFRWSYDAGDLPTSGALSYRDGRAVASGMVTVAQRSFAVELVLDPVRFACLLSKDAGAHMSTGTFQLTLRTPGIDWDKATWIDAGLQMSYHVVPGSGFGTPPEVVVAFEDRATGVSWVPEDQSSSMTHDLTLVYDAAGEAPPSDSRSHLSGPATAFSAVLPLQMIAMLSPDAQSLDAAIAVDSASVPTVYAVRGTYLDGPPAIPAPATRAAVMPSPRTGPDPSLLANITPFQTVTGADGATRTIDVVQRAAAKDFRDILMHTLPDELLALVAPMNPVTHKPERPPLDADVATIANLPGADGTTAAAFYASLGVPYLTQVLARSTVKPPDPFAKTLNANRARLWMSQQTAAASVYNTQLPALYNMRFAKLVPDINPYVDDQKANAATYAPSVLADAAAWKQEIIGSMSKPSPDDVKAFTDMVDELSQLGANGCYWAYRLFRFATAPSTLRGLQAGSMAPGQGNTSFAVRMQGYCAVLAMLDPSGTFTKRYAQTLSMVQISNVFSQLIDYDGKADGLKYVVPRLIQAFLQRYADSPDPDVQKAMAELLEAQHNGKLDELIQAFVNLSSEVSGAYEWRTLTNAFKPAAANGLLFAADLVAGACAIGGIAMFALGVRNFGALTADQQANVVIGGTELFVNTAISLIKRTFAIGEIFSSQALRWEKFKIAINPLIDNLTKAQENVLTGLVKRVIGQTNADAAAAARATGAYALLADPNDPVDMTTAERWLGRNLDEFTIRLGVVFGVANLVMSAIALSESHDPLGVASNSLFVAGAALETLTYAAGWFVQGALAVTEATLDLLSQIMSACTIVAAALAIAGLIVAIVEMCEHHATPLETFATTEASGAGLYMPLGYEIESLQTLAPAGEPSRVAVSLSGRPGAVLRMAADATVSIGTADHSNASCLQLLSNGTGQFRIASIVPTQNTSTICLTAKDSVLSAQPYADPMAKDGAAVAAAQLWWATPLVAAQTVTIPGDAPNDPPTTAVQSGTFAISSASDPTKYLDLAGAAPQLSPTPSAITIAMTTVAPQGLTMADPLLSTNDRDRRFMPNLTTAGSAPRQFTLAPALPPTFSFDPATGIIAQEIGATPPPTPAIAYTLTCDNGVAPAATVDFHVAVTPAPARA